MNLLERAAALVPEAEVDVPLELGLVTALAWGGKAKAREALRRAGSVADRAAAAGDRLGELCARIEEGSQRAHLESEGAVERLAALAEEALASARRGRCSLSCVPSWPSGEEGS